MKKPKHLTDISNFLIKLETFNKKKNILLFLSFYFKILYTVFSTLTFLITAITILYYYYFCINSDIINSYSNLDSTYFYINLNTTSYTLTLAFFKAKVLYVF